MLSVSALFGGLAQAARSLTVLVSTCARTATVEEGCAASIETVLVPATLFINGGIAISAACDKGQMGQRQWMKGYEGMGFQEKYVVVATKAGGNEMFSFLTW